MKNIKFRIWNGSEMEYRIMAGYLGAFYVQGLDEKDYACLSKFNTKYGDHAPLMQFTGLHDKNGKDGYHKDIVAAGKKLYTIEWQQEEARFWLAPQNHSGSWKFMDELNHMEIIGNIYSNPSLLTTKTEQ